MEDLRVWVDGVERIVQGASEETTCENVLVALANATGKLGRFALLEKWRDLERILPREAKPIQCLRMWGKQAGEVKFVLKLMKDKNARVFGNVNSVDYGNEEESLSFSDDPFHFSFQKSSLEKVVANQCSKFKRLESDLEIIQLRIDSCLIDEESYLYFTEEEINEDRITKLGQVVKLQSKELAAEENCLIELAKERQRHENLRQELRDQREKLHLLDVHISDLESVGRKIYSMRLSQDKKSDTSQSSTSYEEDDLEELGQDISATREELTKQRDLAEKQVEEVALMKKSLADLENLSREKSFHLLTLIGDPSPEASLSYYDLEKNLELNDASVEIRNSNKFDPVPASRSLSRDGTQGDLPHGNISKTQKTRSTGNFVLNGFDTLDDPGVFV